MDKMIKNYPDRETAEQILAWACRQNEGPWVAHSRVAARAAETIAKACGLDGEKAYALGLMHDIGRYEGARGLHHVFAGYALMKDKFYEDCARICMTHSFPVPLLEAYSGGDLDCTEPEMRVIRDMLDTVVYDDYDKLIQLCDGLSLPQGVCLMDVRLMDVVRRHGFNTFTLRKWDAQFAIKKHFDRLSGMNIYDLFYDEIRSISFA